MREKSFKEFINSASKHAILLSIVTIASIIISSLTTSMDNASLIFVIKAVTWCAKVFLIGYLLYRFVKSYGQRFEDFSYGDGFRYSLMICLLSSILCTVFMMFNLSVLFPEIQDAALAAIEKSTNSTDILENASRNMTKYLAIFSFFYYAFIGLIASAIVASFTKKEIIF